MKLWQQILIAMFLGITTGLFFKEDVLWMKIIGDSFLSLIHMLILPLVFSSVTLGIASIHDPSKLSRVGTKTLVLYISTTILSVILGIAVGYMAQPLPGELSLSASSLQAGAISANGVQHHKPSIGEILANVIPKNPIRAFVEGNVLQVIFFSCLLGLAITMSPRQKVQPLVDVIRGIASIMLELTQLIMKLSPVGIYAIVAWAAATFGVEAVYSMARFLFFYYGACFFHLTVTLGLMLRLGAKIPLRLFIRKSWDSLVMAFSTCSSSATLPVALECLTEKMGVGRAVASFMLPLGTAINMNGAAIYQGMSALFLCGIYGIELQMPELVELVAVAVFSAIGSAGIPGTGFIMLSVVLSSVGIPLEGLALLAGIDRVREMISTVTNISSDIACCLVVARQEGEIDQQVLMSDA